MVACFGLDVSQMLLSWMRWLLCERGSTESGLKVGLGTLLRVSRVGGSCSPKPGAQEGDGQELPLNEATQWPQVVPGEGLD